MKVKGPMQAETWKAQMPRDEIFILACFFMQSSDTNGCEPETPHFVRGKRVCRPIHSIHIRLISCDSVLFWKFSRCGFSEVLSSWRQVTKVNHGYSTPVPGEKASWKSSRTVSGPVKEQAGGQFLALQYFLLDVFFTHVQGHRN